MPTRLRWLLLAVSVLTLSPASSAQDYIYWAEILEGSVVCKVNLLGPSSGPLLTYDAYIYNPAGQQIAYENKWTDSYRLQGQFSAPVETDGTYTCTAYFNVDGDYIGQTTVQRHMVAPRQPSDLRHIWESFTYTAPGNYLRDRHYQVYDEFNGPYTYDGTPVWESFAITSNGCNMTIETEQTTLNADGVFGDKYGNITGPMPQASRPSRPKCPVLRRSCRSGVRCAATSRTAHWIDLLEANPCLPGSSTEAHTSPYSTRAQSGEQTISIGRLAD